MLAVNANEPVVARRIHGGQRAGDAIIRIRAPALRVPNFHARRLAIRAFAVNPTLHARHGTQALVMDGHEIKPLEEVVFAIAKILVERVGRGIAAAQHHLHPTLATGLFDALAHRHGDLAKPGDVRAPAGDRHSLPRLVPKLDGVDRSLGPAEFQRHALHPGFEISVVLRQPRDVADVFSGVERLASAILDERARAPQRLHFSLHGRLVPKLHDHRQASRLELPQLGHRLLIVGFVIGIARRTERKTDAVGRGPQSHQRGHVVNVHAQAVAVSQRWILERARQAGHQ